MIIIKKAFTFEEILIIFGVMGVIAILLIPAFAGTFNHRIAAPIGTTQSADAPWAG